MALSPDHTVQITKAKSSPANKTDKLDGIPFYIKKAACKHEVVLLEPVYTLTLEGITTTQGAEAKPDTIQGGAVVLSLSQYREDPAVQTFLTAFSEAGHAFPDVLDKWNAITKIPYTPTGFPKEAKDRVLVSNTSTAEVYVDYAETYYVNGTTHGLGPPR